VDPSSARAVLAIERPHSSLMTLYLLRSCAVPPFSLVALPFLYFRYHTMRYRFDEDGVSMRWGILFRREVSLSYARIQDIHLTSGILQRWLGLADIHIQTASGSSKAEMTIEGLREFEAVRDFLYSKMRRARRGAGSAEAEPDVVGATASTNASTSAAASAPAGAGRDELAAALRQVAAELRATRLALEGRDRPAGGGDV
jgi:putative membrane protein